MFKKLLGLALMLVIGVGVMLADEAKGKVTKYEKGTVTVKVGDKDTDFSLKGAKVYDGDTEVTKADRKALLKDVVGKEVTVVYTKDGDTVKVTEFKVKK